MNRVLIDTHVFIWWTGEPQRLSELAHNFLVNPENKPVLSFTSIWEMQIKLSLGKLTLKTSLSELVEDEIGRNGLSLLPIELSHIYALSDLPPHHRDPFDRLLIAQSTSEEIPIISIDDKFDVYGVQRLWQLSLQARLNVAKQGLLIAGDDGEEVGGLEVWARAIAHGQVKEFVRLGQVIG